MAGEFGGQSTFQWVINCVPSATGCVRGRVTRGGTHASTGWLRHDFLTAQYFLDGNQSGILPIQSSPNENQGEGSRWAVEFALMQAEVDSADQGEGNTVI